MDKETLSLPNTPRASFRQTVRKSLRKLKRKKKQNKKRSIDKPAKNVEKKYQNELKAMFIWCHRNNYIYFLVFQANCHRCAVNDRFGMHSDNSPCPDGLHGC